MGLFEVLHHLPRLLRLRATLRAAMLDADGPTSSSASTRPEFNLGLAPALHAAGLRTVQYVSPQVWAWRRGACARIGARPSTSCCACCRSNAAFYDAAGVRAMFVGHPLADQMPLEPDRAAARRALGLAPRSARRRGAARQPQRRGRATRRRLSRRDRLARARAGRALRSSRRMANADARATFEAALARRRAGRRRCTLVDGQAQPVLAAADVVLVASGTATLETLLCKRPMVVAYRLGALTAFAAAAPGLLKAPFFAQPNLLAGRRVVPELSQDR